MNEMTLFKNGEFGELGVILVGGKEYFPATACAKILGYANPRDAIKRHCKPEGCVKCDGVSRTTNQHGVTTEQSVSTNYINEGNLYRLIVSSKLPAAERFERWVFDEVLPTIRKQGSYITMDKLMEAIQLTVATTVAEVVKQLVPVLMATPRTSIQPDMPKRKVGPIPLLAKLPEDTRLELFDMIISNEYSVKQILAWLRIEHNIVVSDKTIYRHRERCRNLTQSM